MSHYIVLVKQVPDVTQITDNAFDPETGNLMRGRLASVINELDAQALAFADRMRQLGGAGRIIALTMGPPMAEEVLRFSLARGADEAVLLSDRALGGADTWATANPLAHAVRRIVREKLAGDDDYYIVSGMQSVDGDTAQVPAQMAEELGIPCIAYATDVRAEKGHLEFTRIISGGSQVVKPRRVPAIITVAKYEFPLFATFAGTRWARRADITRWAADDVKPTAVGVKGSKTRVVRVFPPDKSRRKCQRLSSVEELAATLKACLGNGAAHAENAAAEQRRYLLPAKRPDRWDRGYEGTLKEVQAYAWLSEQVRRCGAKEPAQVDDAARDAWAAAAESAGLKLNRRALDEMLAGYDAVQPAYKGEVWVVAEHDNEKLHDAAFELIGKARDLAEGLDTAVGAVLVGSSVRGLAAELIAAGADKVYLVEDPLLAQFDPTALRKAVAEVISRHWPQIVLYGATPQGRVLAPMVSYRLGCGLTADCTGLDIRDNSRKGEVAVLMQTRPALGGNVMATICTKDSRSQMATARPGVFQRLPADAARRGEIIAESVTLGPADLTVDVVRTEKSLGGVNFNADIIVSGGKGLQSKDSYERLISELTQTIAGRLNCTVERGASRAAVEQGYTDRAHQVGQTGTAVGPRVYLALGISGAIQHMIGVANSENIFAVNSDPSAPILKQCDYYLIGNAEDVAPRLAAQLGGK